MTLLFLPFQSYPSIFASTTMSIQRNILPLLCNGLVGQSQFEWLAENKRHQSLFNSYMSSRREGKPNWFDVYPVNRLTEGAICHLDAVFLVDIGGNQGHDLEHSMTDIQTLGTACLQDLPKYCGKRR